MTTSQNVPASIPSDLAAQLHVQSFVRLNAALVFAQTYQSGEPLLHVREAFANFEEEDNRYKLLWSAAIRTAEARKGNRAAA